MIEEDPAEEDINSPEDIPEEKKNRTNRKKEKKNKKSKKKKKNRRRSPSKTESDIDNDAAVPQLVDGSPVSSDPDFGATSPLSSKSPSPRRHKQGIALRSAPTAEETSPIRFEPLVWDKFFFYVVALGVFYSPIYITIHGPNNHHCALDTTLRILIT